MMPERGLRSLETSTSTTPVSRLVSCYETTLKRILPDMSQPKFQLETFKSWAGIDSDISYYLNSHHIDVRSCHA